MRFFLILSGSPDSIASIRQSINLEHYDFNNIIRYPKNESGYDQSLNILILNSHPASVFNNIKFNTYKIKKSFIEIDKGIYNDESGEVKLIFCNDKDFNNDYLIEYLTKIKNYK